MLNMILHGAFVLQFTKTTTMTIHFVLLIMVSHVEMTMKKGRPHLIFWIISLGNIYDFKLGGKFVTTTISTLKSC
jgi:hypothetical protein